MNNDGIGSTKFITTAGIVILTFVALIVGKVQPELWEEISLIGLSVFTAGNVISKFAPVKVPEQK